MRIYLADLTEYASGRLKGAWLDLNSVETIYEIKSFVHSTILVSPNNEFAIHDYDEFPDLGEYPSLDKVLSAKKLVLQYGLEVVSAFIICFGKSELNHLEDAYFGTYKDIEDFAQQYAADCMEIPDDIVNYIDWTLLGKTLLSADFNGVPTEDDSLVVFVNW